MRALPLVVIVLLAAAPAAAQNGTGNASDGNASDAPPPFLEGTRDPSNSVWWYAALAFLVLVFIAALWVMGVLPR